MPRTDENGRQLKALLDYLLDGEIDSKDLFDALGISSSTYYRRIKETDYPNAEELRRVADRFELSYPDLQVQFGLMSRQEVWNYVRAAQSDQLGSDQLGSDQLGSDQLGSDQMGLSTLQHTTTEPIAAQRRKLADLAPRLDAPPL